MMIDISNFITEEDKEHLKDFVQMMTEVKRFGLTKQKINGENVKVVNLVDENGDLYPICILVDKKIQDMIS